jgi:NDP-sugar pyrophosphorylase family protein
MAIESLVLVGGLGTRLRPAVGDIPKPMAEVAGRPFLAYLLRRLAGDGFHSVTLLTGYRAGAVEQYFGSGAGNDLSIAYSPEPVPLGTAGALRNALPRLAGRRFLVMNGDSYFDIDLAAFVDAAGDAPASLALVRVPEAGRFGSVVVDAGGLVSGFCEKSASGGPGLINAGVYVLDREVIAAVPENRPTSLEREVFPHLVGRGLRGIAFDAFFVDIGVPEAYAGICADPAPLLRSSSEGRSPC